MAFAKWALRSLHFLDRRIRARTLLGVSALVGVLAVVLVLPAFAGSGNPSGAGVQPDEVSYGGGSGACGVYSDASKELHINNPGDGTFTGPDGTRVALDVYSGDKYFDFEMVNNPDLVVYDVIVNGGAKNTHFDYVGTVGAVRDDTALHAPTKGNSNNLYKLSHVNICYDVSPTADLSVAKRPVPEADPFVADVGDQVTFEILVSNAGPATATNVVVTDDLPAGMTFVSASDGGTEGPAGTIRWTIPSIADDGSKTLSLTVEIGSGASGQSLVNEVSVSGDQDDPTPNNDDAVSVPPVTVRADVSGTKFHDRDTDGELDATQEEGLGGWTFTAFADGEAIASSDPSDAEDGSYTIESLTPGDYVICEATNTSGLPEDGLRYWWSWTQSIPSGNTLCGDFEGYNPAGQAITVDGDETGVDFGNHIQVTIDCEAGDVVVPLGGDGLDDDPRSVVTVPGGCPSGTFTSTYDVGRSNPDEGDNDPWTQFVVFGGNPDGEWTISQTIDWDQEPADYQDGSLVVPTTQVQLMPGGSLQPVDFCAVNDPSFALPHCLVNRTISEGQPLDPGHIQLTENFKFLGDPGNFR